MSNIFIMRHGESLGNVQGYLVAGKDPQLTKNGAKQVALAAGPLIELGLSEIISSGRQRAIQSAEILSKNLSLPMRVEHRANDIFAGKETPQQIMNRADELYAELKALDRKILLITHVDFMQYLFTASLNGGLSSSPNPILGNAEWMKL